MTAYCSEFKFILFQRECVHWVYFDLLGILCYADGMEMPARVQTKLGPGITSLPELLDTVTENPRFMLVIDTSYACIETEGGTYRCIWENLVPVFPNITPRPFAKIQRYLGIKRLPASPAVLDPTFNRTTNVLGALVFSAGHQK